MTREPTEASKALHLGDRPSPSFSHSSQHGFHLGDDDSSGLLGAQSSDSRGQILRSRDDAPRGSGGGVNADVLDEKLRGLRNCELDGARVAAAVPGQRVSEYEDAFALQTPKQALVRDLPDGAVQLDDLPNEILTHIFSHMPPDSHSSVSLVSRRFSALISTHHAWRMAFMRHFPGHTSSALLSSRTSTRASERSETRYFARLTPNATWRSEYLLRTRYLRSLARGKPGTASDAALSGGPRQGKKPAAVLTFNSRLPWRATSLHAAFSNGTRPPRVIQGSGDFGMATIGDPTTGKIEKWGVEDMFFAAQLEDVAPGLVPYSLGAGPLAVPNVVDVSQCYGMICGEGFPGGRSYYRGVNEPRGRCLNTGNAAATAADSDEAATIPRIPEGLDAICSVWIAKSPAVVSTTHNMCGMLTGSSLGVITAYSLGNGSAGARHAGGEVTARWVPCPGVPIVSLRVDDGYCQTRKSPGRVWAVALNALGEVFYLTQVPVGRYVRATGQEAMRYAWHAGRTACWHLLEDTRRVAKSDADDEDPLFRGHSPRYHSVVEEGLDNEKLVEEARAMERLMRVMPLQFCDAFEGWDMQRRLEVDFASDDAKGAGESIFVIDCGLEEASPARVRRYTRSSATQPKPPRSSVPITAPPTPSLFAGIGPQASPQAAVEPQSPRSPPPTPKCSVPPHAWLCRTLDLHGHENSVISALALDNSSTCLLTLADEASYAADHGSRLTSPWADAAIREVPGRRARFLVAGTHDGAVLVWNARDEAGKGTPSPVQPVRVIRTDSPRVTCVAASALYVVHGGSDGLVQAWDPLASTREPVRTICAKSHARAPRLIVPPNPRFHESDLASVGAIYLDPDPTILQGVVAFGVSLRSWSYGSSGRLMTRHKGTAGGRTSEAEGRLSRRQASLFTGHIAAEEAELRREEAQRAREREQMMKRFGALGDLTQDEALAYAQMLSEEEFARQGGTDGDGDGDMWSGSSASEAGPSEVRAGGDFSHDGDGDGEGGYEEQMQQAIRLSLMEVEDGGRYKYGEGDEGGGSWRYDFKASSGLDEDRDEDRDLMLALRMSVQDQGGWEEGGEFPSLPDGGKGKGVLR